MLRFRGEYDTVGMNSIVTLEDRIRRSNQVNNEGMIAK